MFVPVHNHRTHLNSFVGEKASLLEWHLLPCVCNENPLHSCDQSVVNHSHYSCDYFPNKSAGLALRERWTFS